MHVYMICMSLGCAAAADARRATLVSTPKGIPRYKHVHICIHTHT